VRRPQRQNGIRVLADETHGSVRAQMDKDPSFVPHHSKPRAIPLASSLDDYTFFFIPGDSCRCGFWAGVGLGCRVHRYYVPMEGVFHLTIYDRWGQRELERFKSAGLKTEVLWSRPRQEKGLTGTEVRERMALGEEWEHMVPPATAALVKNWEIPERLCQLYATGNLMERSGGSKILVCGSLSAGRS
jgi:hypothetical protein